jgi:hypothetical protein
MASGKGGRQTKLAWNPARRSAWRTPLRNISIWSAAVRASVGANTASTWLGPEFDLHRQQRHAQRLRRALHDAHRLVGHDRPSSSASRL